MGVALFDSSTPLIPLRDELRAAVDRVLDSERYILGPEVAAFERASCWQDAVQLRRFDDMGKRAEISGRIFADFIPLMRELLGG